jgi:hypothetical protein
VREIAGVLKLMGNPKKSYLAGKKYGDRLDLVDVPPEV